MESAMQFVDSILYRHVTDADFMNIEAVRKPKGGGGQTYIDLSAVENSLVRSFFLDSTAKIAEAFTKTDLNGEIWPAFTVPVSPISGGAKQPLELDMRSGGAKRSFRNYRIKNQAITQDRHPAWQSANGFPTILGSRFRAPGNYDTAVLSQAISRLYTNLCIFIVRTKLGHFHAGFIDGTELPNDWPRGVGLELLTDQKERTGIIEPTELLEIHPSKVTTENMRLSSVQPYSIQQFHQEVFMSDEKYKQITALLQRKKNIILQGSPGTGKTFAAKRLAYSLMGAKDESCICSVQFHQNSTYEDYIAGFRPDKSGEFKLTKGTFAKFFAKASERPDENFYLIIDEINRANVSKVFGELLMAIEADHRGESLTLPVGEDDSISVPHNVFLIGMMNTADRGLALIDYALRRRFAFVNMEPALDNEQFLQHLHKLDSNPLSNLVQEVCALNQEIESDPSLGPGFKIGHSYFCIDAPIDYDLVHSIVEFELSPLLHEYWFDQPEKAEEAIARLYQSIA